MAAREKGEREEQNADLPVFLVESRPGVYLSSLLFLSLFIISVYLFSSSFFLVFSSSLFIPDGAVVVRVTDQQVGVNVSADSRIETGMRLKN